jgi:ATP-binding protein involved in chromosome partitioning
MPAGEDRVRQALRGVYDPQIRRDVVDLGMVRSIEAGAGRARVVLALPVDEHPDEAEMVSTARGAVMGTDGLGHVDVEVTTMTEAERHRLRDRLWSEGVEVAPKGSPSTPRPEPLGHEEGRPNIFMRPGSQTRVLGISSGKGGVGKSSVTVNLAVALSRLEHEVAVLDADVYGFSLPAMLGISHDPMVFDDVLIPPVAHRIRCMSIGFFVGDDQPVLWRGPMLHKALEQFLVDPYWGEPDFLLVDMPPGTGDVALSMSQYLPRTEILLVTTPQPAAQRVAQRSAYAARRLRLPLRGVIENMSWFTADDGARYLLFGSGGGDQLASELGVPMLGRVPLVPALREGGDAGMPVTVSEPEGEAAQAFEALARRVDGLGPSRVYKEALSVHPG